jgi:hypothetical protein
MSRLLTRSTAALLLVWACGGYVRAVEPDTFSKVVSFQYEDSLDEPGTTIQSQVVSFQYFDKLDDADLTFATSAAVSFYRSGGEPVILSGPTSQSVKVGDALTLSVTATGDAPLSYQWCLNGAIISSANTATLTRPHAQMTDAGTYSVTVSNGVGSEMSETRVFSYQGPTTPMPTVPSMTTAGSTPAFLLTLPPPPGKLMVFNASGQLVENGPMDTSKMTIVLTHGWLSSPAPPNWPTAMWQALKDARLSDLANIVAWDWATGADDIKLWRVADRTPREGEALGQALMDKLGASYNQSMHFMGHSLGTLVNCRAADYIHGDGKNSPAKNPATPTLKLDPQKTHMTLFDEAQLAVPVNGMSVALDVILGNSRLTNGEGSNSPAKVIPERARYIDNYISEVGLLHSRAANVLLWRKYTFGPVGLHAYAYEWYLDSITPISDGQLGLGGRRMGFPFSFERGSISSAPAEETFFLQSLDVSASPLAVTQMSSAVAQQFSRNRVRAYEGMKVYQSVAYPTYQAYRGLNAAGQAVQGVYMQGIQYAGTMLADFAETFTAPVGQPVYLGTAGSTAAYFTESGQPAATTFQASWDLQFRIQSGTAPQQSLMGAAAKRNGVGVMAAANSQPAFSVIPMEVPHEAVGLTFEYKIEGAADGDFMTMGIGEEIEYSMEAMYVADGEWNAAPVIQVENIGGAQVQLVFGLSNPAGQPSGALSIRNIQFYIPPRPQVSLEKIGAEMKLSWPLHGIGWTLETTTDLTQPNSWQPVANPSTVEDYQRRVNLTPTGPRQFFRLRK